MLNKIDGWLIDRLYQTVVDLTQKRPAWWVEQCGFMLFVFGMLRHFLAYDPNDPLNFLLYLAALLDLLLATMFFFNARVPALMQRIMADKSLRLFILVMSPFGIWLSIDKPWPLLLVRVIYEMAIVSGYYFAACQAPRPPKRREELAITPA